MKSHKELPFSVTVDHERGYINIVGTDPKIRKCLVDLGIDDDNVKVTADGISLKNFPGGINLENLKEQIQDKLTSAFGDILTEKNPISVTVEKDALVIQIFGNINDEVKEGILQTLGDNEFHNDKISFVEHGVTLTTNSQEIKISIGNIDPENLEEFRALLQKRLTDEIGNILGTDDAPVVSAEGGKAKAAENTEGIVVESGNVDFFAGCNTWKQIAEKVATISSIETSNGTQSREELNLALADIQKKTEPPNAATSTGGLRKAVKRAMENFKPVLEGVETEEDLYRILNAEIERLEAIPPEEITISDQLALMGLKQTVVVARAFLEEKGGEEDEEDGRQRITSINFVTKKGGLRSKLYSMLMAQNGL